MVFTYDDGTVKTRQARSTIDDIQMPIQIIHTSTAITFAPNFRFVFLSISLSLAREINRFSCIVCLFESIRQTNYQHIPLQMKNNSTIPVQR